MKDEQKKRHSSEIIAEAVEVLPKQLLPRLEFSANLDETLETESNFGAILFDFVRSTADGSTSGIVIVTEWMDLFFIELQT